MVDSSKYTQYKEQTFISLEYSIFPFADFEDIAFCVIFIIYIFKAAFFFLFFFENTENRYNNKHILMYKFKSPFQNEDYRKPFFKKKTRTLSPNCNHL